MTFECDYVHWPRTWAHSATYWNCNCCDWTNSIMYKKWMECSSDLYLVVITFYVYLITDLYLGNGVYAWSRCVGCRQSVSGDRCRSDICAADCTYVIYRLQQPEHFKLAEPHVITTHDNNICSHCTHWLRHSTASTFSRSSLQFVHMLHSLPATLPYRLAVGDDIDPLRIVFL